MKAWQLNRVDDIEFVKDTSGIYCLIVWDVQTDTVRIDFMSDNHEPLVSFAGTSDNVRKHSMRYLESLATDDGLCFVSLEHAAYIGSELEKADTMRIDYIQDGTKKVTSDNTHLTDSELLEKTERDNKQKANDITEKYDAALIRNTQNHKKQVEACEIIEKYNKQMVEQEQYNFMIVLDATRFVKFECKIDSTNALACSSTHYLHECPDTNRVFLCEFGIDNNIAELKDVQAFQEWLNSNDR